MPEKKMKKGADALKLGRQLQAWQKAMASYCWVYNYCHLWAVCLGSGP